MGMGMGVGMGIGMGIGMGVDMGRREMGDGRWERGEETGGEGEEGVEGVDGVAGEVGKRKEVQMRKLGEEVEKKKCKGGRVAGRGGR